MVPTAPSTAQSTGRLAASSASGADASVSDVVASPALPVRLDGVSRTFPAPGAARDAQAGRTVLHGVDLEVAPGEIVAVLGPSGCGKSTLLRQVSGLDAPTGGRVTIDGGSVVGADPRTAVAFQEPRLLPWRTLTQNVALGLPPGTAKDAGRARVAQLLDLVGLAASAGLRPRQVSGGMAQRASLARALARNPGVLLLDEPFGALDALTRLRMQDLLLDVHAAQPATILLVTHDVEEALYLADRVVLLRTLADAGSDDGAASIARIVDVPGDRPRDRAARDLAELRAELLDGLGVPTHHDR
ncbi:ABC transporter ATP-binding protein [Promicromonospora sukumoe]|uniref:ABC transporter ATP-binding protein n=1 Tax=Promicromonospora sukumoe TaxID=88382 RepID=UPI0037C5C111